MPPLFPVRLRWPPAPGPVRYRVVARHIIPDQLLTLESDEPELQVNVRPVVEGPWPEWRVQVRHHEEPWTDHLPYLDWPANQGESDVVLRWSADEVDLHRVVVHDDTAGEIVLRAATLEPLYRLDCSRLRSGHKHRWRAQRWVDDAWVDLGPYRPLPESQGEAVVGGQREPATGKGQPEPATGKAPARVLFLFTSDTEVHMRWMPQPDGRRGIQEQIFGRFGGQEVGIGLQMSLLDAHGFKGTFFVDVLSEYQFGEESLAPVFEEILERGHDVQLHLHAAPHLRFAKDERIRRLSNATNRDDPASFRAALELAIELYERRAGRPPVAYRAGAYRIYSSHFPILRELGILLDSSVNPLKNCRVPPWLAAATQPEWVDGVLEVPVTWYLRRDGGPEQLAPVPSGRAQGPAVAAAVAGAGSPPPRTLCYIAHSYSFLGTTKVHDQARWEEWNARWKDLVGAEEWEISRYNVGAPLVELSHVDHRRIDTFTGLLDDLGRRPEVAGSTFAELAAHRDLLVADTGGLVNAVACYDRAADRASLTRTRRYSASYLENLESENAARQLATAS